MRSATLLGVPVPVVLVGMSGVRSATLLAVPGRAVGDVVRIMRPFTKLLATAIADRGAAVTLDAAEVAESGDTELVSVGEIVEISAATGLADRNCRNSSVSTEMTPFTKGRRRFPLVRSIPNAPRNAFSQFVWIMICLLVSWGVFGRRLQPLTKDYGTLGWFLTEVSDFPELPIF
ncbi:MAG: hypothetical protein HZA46_05160 [Planctomycetales bacterium]|nr:hypothetical protein [Planctomycetales bacterium]